MNIELLQLLACPVDGHFPFDVSVSRADSSDIIEGDLSCRQCGGRYRISSGIPSLLSPETLEARQGTEIHVRDNEAEDFESFYSDYHTTVELELIRNALSGTPRNMILDAGCGTGRLLLGYAGDVRATVGVDFSLQSLLRLQRRLQRQGIQNVQLVHGDLSALPFVPGCFDACVCCEVLEHFPTADLRRSSVTQFTRVLTNRGKLICTVYNFNLRYRLLRAFRNANERARKEGYHSNGRIYFYNFSHVEARRLFAAGFDVERIRGIDCAIPFITDHLRNLRRPLDRLLCRTPLGRALGSCLLITGRKRKSGIGVQVGFPASSAPEMNSGSRPLMERELLLPRNKIRNERVI
jgi:ubiquinone/menaquinone biosynthesis C-methylase UbiE